MRGGSFFVFGGAMEGLKTTTISLRLQFAIDNLCQHCYYIGISLQFWRNTVIFCRGRTFRRKTGIPEGPSRSPRTDIS